MKNIRTIFEDVGSDLVVNKELLDRIQRFEQGFTHRNAEHIEFFGGHLLGVDRVRFLPSDWAILFDDVFQIDDTELEKRLHALPSINKDHTVASDVLNLTCVYMAHLIINTKPSKDITSAMIYNGAMNSLLIFQYKVLTSKIANDFKFDANKDLMTTVYANLSLKFSIKRYGSWSALLRARAEDVLSTESIHHDTLRKLDDDYKTKYIVTDMQGRLRSIVKEHWDVINAVQDGDSIIQTTASTIETDDGASVKELERFFPAYLTYLHSIVGEPSNFIKDELIKITAAAMHTMSPLQLRTLLNYVSDSYREGHDDLIERTLDQIMTHAFEFIRTRYKGSMSTPDLAFIIKELRGMYTSSRSTDDLLLSLRVNIDRCIHRKLKGISPAATASLRVGFALYVVLRTLTKKKYST